MILSRKQVEDIAEAMKRDNVEEVELNSGSDGRLIVKQAITTRKYKAMPLKKRQTKAKA